MIVSTNCLDWVIAFEFDSEPVLRTWSAPIKAAKKSCKLRDSMEDDNRHLRLSIIHDLDGM
jgi:hypothetical protein